MQVREKNFEEEKVGEAETTYEFYIHFDGMDKRYDRWAHQDELSKSDSLAETQSKVIASSAAPSKQPDAPRMMLTRSKRGNRNSTTTLDKVSLFHNPEEQEFEKRHEEKTKIKYINKIVIGECTIDTWYYSPYPNEYSACSVLYICQLCLKYFRKQKTLVKHECVHSGPPGQRIYTDADHTEANTDYLGNSQHHSNS